MKLVVVFNGTGGVGKTTVLRHLESLRQDLPFSFSVVPSPTRSVYAKMGLSSEKDALDLSLDLKEKFQDLVFETYRQQALDMRDACKADVLVFDRGVHDYASYQLCSFPNWSQDRVFQLEQDTRVFISKMYYGVKVLQVQFPTPAPWITSSPEDMFLRHAPYAKNLVWDCVLMNVKANWRDPATEVKDITLRSASVDSRTDEIVNAVSWFL